jgi:hypothetical protein
VPAEATHSAGVLSGPVWECGDSSPETTTREP